MELTTAWEVEANFQQEKNTMSQRLDLGNYPPEVQEMRVHVK